MGIWDREGEPEPWGLSAFELRAERGLEDWDITTDDRLVLHCRHPKHRGWAIKAIYETLQDDVTLSHLTIYPAGQWAPEGGLTDDVRRSVRLDDLRKKAKRVLQFHEVSESIGVNPSAFMKNTARGRRGRSDLDFAEIARDYAALIDGEVEHAADVLADQMDLSVSTVRGLVWQARKRGLLTSAPAGQEGGQLTGRAKGILNGR